MSIETKAVLIALPPALLAAIWYQFLADAATKAGITSFLLQHRMEVIIAALLFTLIFGVIIPEIVKRKRAASRIEESTNEL